MLVAYQPQGPYGIPETGSYCRPVDAAQHSRSPHLQAWLAVAKREVPMCCMSSVIVIHKLYISKGLCQKSLQDEWMTDGLT